MKKISIIGLGWFGMEFARTIAGKWEVIGTKTKPPSSQPEGITIFPMVLTPELQSEFLDEIFDADTAVVNIPPSLDGVTDDYKIAMLAMVRKLAASRVQHVIFLSSTGVFSSSQTVVDEDSKPAPRTNREHLLRDVEMLFIQEFPRKLSIVRPGGLVGPERFPAKFIAGKKGVKGANHPVNLVHRDDLIRLVEVIISKDLDQTIFHAVAAGHPRREDYYTAMSLKMGLPAPQFDQSDLTKGKEINGEKSKTWTGVKFQYDDPYDMV